MANATVSTDAATRSWSRLVRLAPIDISVSSHSQGHRLDEERRWNLGLGLEVELRHFLSLRRDHVGAGELHVLDERRSLESLHEQGQRLDVYRVADNSELRRAGRRGQHRIRMHLSEPGIGRLDRRTIL